MKTQLLETKQKMVLTPKKDTQYVLVPTEKTSVDVIMGKEGINVELLVIFTLKEASEIDLLTQVIHNIPNTSCSVNVKGILFDSAKSSYLGKIIIGQCAKNSVSFLEDNILLIGDKAKSNSQPILEIEANEVKASHGATMGRIAKDQIYYLMSRGLSNEEAQNMIVGGFMESLLTKINDKTIRDKVRKEVMV